MADLPEASVTIDDEAGAFGGGTGFAVVIGCVEKNADATPRVFASTKGLLAQHGYSPAVDYSSMHFEETKKPIIFVGIPSATAGTVTGDDTDVTGTSAVTVAGGSNGVLEEVDASLTVVKGGTIGTDGITAYLSLDGGRTRKLIRLGTAVTYVIPYVGITLSFAAGTLVAGDVYVFTSTAPMWDGAGLTSARTALAAQLKLARSWVIIGDVSNATLAGNVTTEANAYETASDRYVYARVNTRGQNDGETMSVYVAAMATALAAVDGQKRIDISIGRARKLSPVTGWLFRRPAMWAFSLREYQHDLQIPCWRKSDGPLDGWSLEDSDGNIAEFDERVDGGALANRFSCMRTYSNGPRGAFGALSMTRAIEGSLLSRTHNMSVANLACTIAQAETENAIGQVLVLKSDGKAEESSLTVIEGRVNSQLEVSLLANRSEGRRASKAVWKASREDTLNVPGAELNGTLTLLLNGTLEKITTKVRVQTAG
jgi:hypothetical protein